MSMSNSVTGREDELLRAIAHHYLGLSDAVRKLEEYCKRKGVDKGCEVPIEVDYETRVDLSGVDVRVHVKRHSNSVMVPKAERSRVWTMQRSADTRSSFVRCELPPPPPQVKRLQGS